MDQHIEHLSVPLKMISFGALLHDLSSHVKTLH